jgi:transcriptional regulator with PAS, ATPase and Fis domain
MLARFVRNTFPVTVIEIVISSFDVLTALYPYAKSKKRFACIECSTFIERVREVAELLELDMTYYEVEGLTQLETFHQQAAEEGIDIVIGGAFGALWSELTTLPCIIIESSKPAVIDCLKNAMIAFEMLYEEEYKKDYLNTILNHSEEGIISVNKEGRIVVLNRSAEKLLQLPSREIVNKPIGNFVSEYDDLRKILNKRVDRNVFVGFNQIQCMLSRIPVLVEQEVSGALFFLMETECLKEAERKLRLEFTEKGLTAKRRFSEIYSENQNMKRIIEMSIMYSEKDSTILLMGETGCGKEFFAQSIHNASNRSNEAFLAINCATLPSSLLESELFGYVEGAFTGASASGKAGIFELAHRGTLFLDEIAEIDLSVQARLLRVLQEREVMRIGDNKVIPVDVRIIAATNKNLKNEVAERRFRQDLYYRLNILSITIPALRERKEDLPTLIQGLIQEKNELLGCKVTKFDKKLLSILLTYDWPGNIRELSNVVEKIVVLAQFGIAEYKDVSLAVSEIETSVPAGIVTGNSDLTMDEIEMLSIEARLSAFGHNKVKTANSLGIGKATLFRKIKKYNLNTIDS